MGDGVVKRKLHAIDWGSICRSKRNGGLGVERIKDTNRALLAKWVWRFSREDSPLWKRVMCAKYGIKIDNILWKWDTTNNPSSFVKAVRCLFKESSNSAKILEDGMKAVVGCGDKVRFWSDIWKEERPLKFLFPRIFALSNLKDGTICKYGRWEGELWI